MLAATMAMTMQQAQAQIEALTQQMIQAVARAQAAEDQIQQLIARSAAADDAHRKLHEEIMAMRTSLTTTEKDQ